MTEIWEEIDRLLTRGFYPIEIIAHIQRDTGITLLSIVRRRAEVVLNA